MALGIEDYERPDAADPLALKRALVNRLIYVVGKDPVNATPRDWYYAVATVAREIATLPWIDTLRRYYLTDAKRVYYFSLEFLMGRALTNGLLSLGVLDTFRDMVEDLGIQFSELCEIEDESALGNGGLGRLAACLLDSMATLQLPGTGYGIRYEYGMFSQGIESGAQFERPDNWLRYGNPWEFPRPEILYRVQFYGQVRQYQDDQGRVRSQWVDTEEVMAMAYDMPIPGYGVATVNHVRLWTAKATREFDLQYFNQGNYIKAVEAKTASENLSRVLYPDDTTPMGRELRLKQEYFLVSAALQDILKRFSRDPRDFDDLPNEVAIQLNDTHPSVAIAELMRLLVDLYGVDWNKAWGIVVRTFSYTNHTLQPEALETWPIALFETLLPRHLEIIYAINHHFLNEVGHRYPGDGELLQRVSLIDESGERRVRMAHLAFIGSHKVNGVARLHTELMKTTIFRDFYRLFPERFISITNGVTPRRWINQSNPGLAGLITSALGGDWVRELERLQGLAPKANDADFRAAFRAVKAANKRTAAELIERRLGLHVSPDSLFDVQIKRIHEYKRQLLNVLHVIARYNRLRAHPGWACVPRVVVFGGKAAPGYAMAKLIIRLINDVADIVNRDPAVGERLKVVFVPNYNVSRAMELIPAVDLSEQISTAGTEASGTSNMKMALNGALTIGTLDGANVEIREEVGEDNIFIFGHTADELTELRGQGYRPRDFYLANEELRLALDMIGGGYFSPQDKDRYRGIVEALLDHGDRYAVLADFAPYVACQERVDDLYRDPEAWTRKAILNVARCGKFSSDRTVKEYAKLIWGVEPVVD